MGRASAVVSLRQKLRRETDAAILDAAERVVGRVGIGGASMQSIAQEARVAVGTLYNHFVDREGLLRALVVRHRNELSKAIADAALATDADGVEQQAIGFVRAVIETFDSRREFVRAALDSELWRALARDTNGASSSRRVLVQLERRTAEIVDAGIGAKLFSERARERLIACFSGAVQGVLLMRARSEAPPPAPDEARETVQLFLDGSRRGRR